MRIATTSVSPTTTPPRDLIVGEPGSPVASSADPRFAQFKVIRRNRAVVPFEPSQNPIARAKAVLGANGGRGGGPSAGGVGCGMAGGGAWGGGAGGRGAGGGGGGGARCGGAAEPETDGNQPLAWSADLIETSAGHRTRWVCAGCTRRYVRSIEAKLDQEWW